jgi:DNA helicase-2/ATP-dependent DNA helicase PcrA
MSIVKTLDELNALEKLSLINMSYTRLDTYQSCAGKYFYTYIQKEPRSFGAAASMGKAVHSTLEKTDLNNMDEKDMLERLYLNAKHEEEVAGLELGDELNEAAKTIIEEFVDRHDGDTFETIEAELEFNLVIGNALFTGFMDRLDRTPNGGALIQDYKAGKWQASKKSIPTNLQLGLYAVAVRKLFPELWPIRGELYYLRSGDIYSHEYKSHDELDEMEHRIHKVANEIVQSDFFHYTSNTFTCSKMCDFGKSGVCPRGAAVIRKYGN